MGRCLFLEACSFYLIRLIDYSRPQFMTFIHTNTALAGLLLPPVILTFECMRPAENPTGAPTGSVEHSLCSEFVIQLQTNKGLDPCVARQAFVILMDQSLQLFRNPAGATMERPSFPFLPVVMDPRQIRLDNKTR
jgi:hypothetical protein